MNGPTLLIMAAGLGSRYGGMKQIAPVDPENHIIMDYSIYDALQAGFERVVCIIKEEHRADFEETIGSRIASRVKLEYAYQKPDTLPEGFSVPEGRVKPWGTAHAVLAAADLIDGPFAVINADDFYGRDAFLAAARFLKAEHAQNEHAMVGYRLCNTLTENGHVARGICSMDENNYLTGIVERTRIERHNGIPAFTEDDGATYTNLTEDTVVSMNLWCFQKSMMDEIRSRFAGFLAENLPKNPLKCEYFLPLIPNALIHEGKATVEVLKTAAKWYGVTYQADMPDVQAAIRSMKESGLYPNYLWRE